MHTSGINDGCTQICHFNSGLWRDDNTSSDHERIDLAGGLRDTFSHWRIAV